MRLPELPCLLSIGVLPLVRRPISHLPVGLGVLSAQTIPFGLASRRHVESPIDAQSRGQRCRPPGTRQMPCAHKPWACGGRPSRRTGPRWQAPASSLRARPVFGTTACARGGVGCKVWVTYSPAADQYTNHAPLRRPCRCFHPGWGAGGWSCRCLLRQHPFQWPGQFR